ncbi:LPS assembly lipoprotein LptE [Motiliproteus sp. MSK22-1]|uniref:LPS-assembly lipoprotein LptE n=1 Tax=Motiliproteus sp. MSK22-1 TaxID=1897630 RepID=UPI0009775B98|nr:LPS assembly lipoprotein LptE [Motiliproteus sp. MSK22-1]OMH33718.1 hypothetical protein BGP75_11995 [Motiliproteus sp. MSK22-1]
MLKRLSICATALLCVLLSACGFKLRGDVEVPETLQRVYLSVSHETATVKSVKRLLRGNGIEMVSVPEAAPYQLQILSESSERRAATLNSRAKTEEYELRSTLQFQILDKDKKPVLTPEMLITEQVYTFDENNVNAKDAEEALLRREMRDDLARQLVRRYLGLAARKN